MNRSAYIKGYLTKLAVDYTAKSPLSLYNAGQQPGLNAVKRLVDSLPSKDTNISGKPLTVDVTYRPNESSNFDWRNNTVSIADLAEPDRAMNIALHEFGHREAYLDKSPGSRNSDWDTTNERRLIAARLIMERVANHKARKLLRNNPSLGTLESFNKNREAPMERYNAQAKYDLLLGQLSPKGKSRSESNHRAQHASDDYSATDSRLIIPPHGTHMLSGLAIGGLAGGTIGALVSRKNRIRHALLGAFTGTAIGGLAGSQIE